MSIAITNISHFHHYCSDPEFTDPNKKLIEALLWLTHNILIDRPKIYAFKCLTAVRARYENPTRQLLKFLKKAKP